MFRFYIHVFYHCFLLLAIAFSYPASARNFAASPNFLLLKLPFFIPKNSPNPRQKITPLF
jgi:hypothetical protein